MIKDLNVLPGYTTRKNNIGEEFYTPVLSESISFDRISGYFSSTALAYYSKGLEYLLYNNGKYRLIISADISEKDYDLIKTGYLKREIYQGDIHRLMTDISLLSSEIKKSLVNLAFLIEIGLVDIKIGFTKKGIFHAKYGIFTDEENNSIYFTGSFNETGSAFNTNFETLSIQKSWINQENREYIDDQKEEFNKLWNNKNNDGFVFVEEADILLKSELIKFSEGKIIMDETLLSPNSLVIYFENQKLKVRNNSTKVIDEGQRSIIKIKNKYFNSSQLWDFKQNITYSDIENIIIYLKKYCAKKGIELQIADNVKSFIETSKFEIADVSKIGNMIKNKDYSLQKSFDKFNEVIDRDMIRKLRPIQSWVSYYMAKMIRVANFSVPGAGKTAMVYGTYAYLKSDEIDEVSQILVIGPKNSFLAWKEEFFEIFGRVPKTIDVQSSNFREESFSKNINNVELILVNYESLKKYKKYLSGFINKRTMIVFDEVHKIKKIDSERSAIAIEIAERTKYRYVLTGTPIPNSYSDIWNFLHVLYNQEFRKFFNFSKYSLRNPNSFEVDIINKKLSPFFWRVTKKELDVPDPLPDEIMTYMANEDEQSIIDILWKKYSREPFKLYIRLMQLSSNPQLLLKNINKNQFSDYSSYDEEEEEDYTFSSYSDDMNDIPQYTENETSILEKINTSSKFEGCIDKADELMKNNKTIIIWCIFVDTISKVKFRLENMGYRVAVVTGQVPPEERERIIREFQSGDYDVLVTNPHTLAESVSLHKICHNALYLEFSFNLTHMLQSRDRIHRLGLENNIETNYYYFMLEGSKERRNTIDKKIYNRLKEKEEVMLNAIESDIITPAPSSNEREDILQLME